MGRAGDSHLFAAGIRAIEHARVARHHVRFGLEIGLPEEVPRRGFPKEIPMMEAYDPAILSRVDHPKSYGGSVIFAVTGISRFAHIWFSSIYEAELIEFNTGQKHGGGHREIRTRIG